MQNLSHVTKLTMNTTFDCEFKESKCEFKISQVFYSENTEMEEVFEELIYFIKKATDIPYNRKSFDGYFDLYEIYFESYFNNQEVSIFYDKLEKRLIDMVPFDIQCSDEILENLTEEQRENMGDGGESVFLKLHPEWALPIQSLPKN